MQKSPALKAALFGMIGIILGKEIPDYHFLFLSLALIFGITSVGRLVSRRESRSLQASALVLVTLVFAFAFSMSINVRTLLSVDIARFRVFEGQIEESPRDSLARSIILDNPYGYDTTWHAIPGKICLTADVHLRLNAGDRIVFAAKAGPVACARNPGEFNLKEYYLESGLTGRVFLRSRNDLLRIDHATGFGFKKDIIEPIRNYIRSSIRKNLDGDVAELARGMVLGERMGIERDISEEFVNTGTVHVLCVSGLHVGFITGILLALSSLFRIPRRYRFLAIVPFLVLYAFVVGLNPGITRAVIMAVVVTLGLSLQRQSNVLNSLGFAALLILLFNPAQLFSAGFQLSFAAVGSIALFHGRLLALLRGSWPKIVDRTFVYSIINLAALTVSATLGTVPLTTYFFSRISLVSVLANLMVVPLAGFFVSMTFTFIVAGIFSSLIASIFGSAAQLLGFGALRIVTLLGSIGLSNVRITDRPELFCLLYVVWLTSIVLFGRAFLLKKLLFGSLLAANMVVYSSILDSRHDARLVILDVGQGDAIYMQLPNGKSILIDAGMKFRDADAAQRFVVPFLKRRGVSRLDYFIVTHLHADHIGGAETILRNFKVDMFVHPDQFSGSRAWSRTLAAVKALSVPVTIARSGIILDSGETYRIYVIHPNSKYVGSSGSSYRSRLNDGSIVMKICICSQSVLLMGDAEQRVEHELVISYGNFLSSQILKAGHHGSSTSSSMELLKTVHPYYSVISVGAHNSFGHPSQPVIKAMRDENEIVWRTDSLGAASFIIEPDTTRLYSWR